MTYHDGEENYKSYSNAELQQALESISSKKYPANFENLVAEMTSRGIFIEEVLVNVSEPEIKPFIQRPKSVEIAVYILAGTLIIGIFQAIFGPTNALIGDSSKLVFGILILSLIPSIFILYKIWNGRNWSRIIYALFLAYGLWGVAVLIFTGHYPSMSPILLALSILMYIAKITAIALLFMSTSAPWFKR